MTLGQRIKERRELLKMTQDELAKKLGYKSRSSINKLELGLNDVSQSKIVAIADALHTTPSYLMGWDDLPESKSVAPNISEDFVTFPVIGEIAAGFDSIGIEDWTGDSIDVPISYLKGRKVNDFFVLAVKGDSMYPLYQDGDKVLILKCSTLDYSGQIGAVLYDDEYTTLKKVEYKVGEDWLTLVPINPTYRPERIENEALEHCRIIGKPKLLIREIEE